MHTNTTRRTAIATLAAAAIVPTAGLAASNADADLIALAEHYEPLLRQYIDATVEWMPLAMDAHRRARKPFGIAEGEYRIPDDVEGQFRALLTNLHEENGAAAADDRAGVLADEMDPIEDAILDADVKTLAGLRAKALVQLRHIMPGGADDTELEFDGPAEHSLFYAVADLTGVRALADEAEAKLKAANKPAVAA